MVIGQGVQVNGFCSHMRLSVLSAGLFSLLLLWKETVKPVNRIKKSCRDPGLEVDPIKLKRKEFLSVVLTDKQTDMLVEW